MQLRFTSHKQFKGAHAAEINSTRMTYRVICRGLGYFRKKQSHYYGTEVLLRADDGSCLTKILPDKIGRPDESNNKCLRRRCLTVPAPTTYTKHSSPGNRLNDSRARYESLYSAWTEK